MLQTRCSCSSAVMLLYAVSPLYSLHPRPLPAASVRKNARTSNHSGCCSSAARTPPKAASSEVCHRAPRGTFAAGTQSIGKIRRDIVIRPVSQPCQKGYGGNGPTVLVKEAGLGRAGLRRIRGKTAAAEKGDKAHCPTPSMGNALCPLPVAPRALSAAPTDSAHAPSSQTRRPILVLGLLDYCLLGAISDS